MIKHFFFLLIALYQFTPIAFAQNGKALSLDGLSGYMSVTDHDDLDIDIGENFTITMWIKTSQSANFYRLISKRSGPGGTDPGYEMITQTGGGAYGMNLRSTSGTNSGPPFGGTNVTDGAWHHLAMVVNADNNTATIFVDGNQEQQSNVAAIGTQSFANNVAFLVGTEINTSIFYPGLVDEIRLWSVPLTEADIQNDMAVLVDGSETNLIASWDFEEVVGNIVPDLKDQHEGMLFGGANIVDSNAPMEYVGSTLVQRDIPAGQGEMDEGVIAVNVQTIGNISAKDLTNIQFNLDGTTNTNDVSNIKIYYTAGSQRYRAENLFGNASPQAGTISIDGIQTLSEGNNFFWIAFDLSANAVEGNQIDASIESVTVDGELHQLATNSAPGARTILLEHKALFSAGDYGSVNYRITAITTAEDGSLVVAGDARVDQAGDLPNNIDVMIRRSTDNGDTWSDAIAIADFGQVGAGDAALVTDRETGNILCLFPSHEGFFQSTPNNRIRTQLCISEDNGITWTAPIDITDQVNDPSWFASFTASGSAHQMRNGRIVIASAVRENSSNAISNFMIYSDDGGASWNYSPNAASTVGNEAKIVELDNGNLMMNIRNQTPNARQIVISEDDGITWGTPYIENELIDPYVNGDLIRYTSVLDGYEKSRLLFSIASHPTARENMTVHLSYDEGENWPIEKTIYAGRAAYSSLTILPDGTIGLFYENGEYETYQLHFARFSLDWLTNDGDNYLPPVAVNDVDLAHLNFDIIPNPSSGQTAIIFELEQTKEVQIAVYDMKGNIIMDLPMETLQSGTHKKYIEVSDLSNGTYILKLKFNDKIIGQKILVIK